MLPSLRYDFVYVHVRSTHVISYYGLAVAGPYVRMARKQDGGSNQCVSIYALHLIRRLPFGRLAIRLHTKH